MLVAALIGASTAAEPEHRVLVLHDGDPALVEGVRTRLMSTGLLRDTDPWDLVADGVPTTEDLSRYDAVLVWLDTPFENLDLLGDTLAGFVGGNGGGLVLASPTCTFERTPGGRLVSDGLLPWVQGNLVSSDDERALISGPDHDLHGALGVVDAGISPRCLGLAPRGEVPLIWDDGEPLVALHPSLRVAGLNLWPPDSALDPAGWGTDGHGEQVIVRTLMWSAGWDLPSSACRRDTPEPDRNCNGILRSDEPLIDVLDPVCAENVDADGVPLGSFDDYVEPLLYGCGAPVTAVQDADNDGFGSGGVAIYVGELNWGQWDLSCDGCAYDADPLAFDLDCDGRGDLCDACPFLPGESGRDEDDDRIPDACDNCWMVVNPVQDNDDGDRFGNLCDVCPEHTDPAQLDFDEDGMGDVCDPCPSLKGDAADVDQDGVGDRCDLCPDTSDREQSDLDRDGRGDVCDVCPLDAGDQTDTDGDGFGDECDTCPELASDTQSDRDEDGVGDICDPCPEVARENRGDIDGDAVPDVCDVCVRVPNGHQRDTDGDGVGNACDVCPETPDPGQADTDGDGKGDLCDEVWIRGGGRVCDAAGAGAGLWAIGVAWAATRRRRGR